MSNQGQLDPSQLHTSKRVKSTLEFFKHYHNDEKLLFSLEDDLTRDEAKKLYDNFDKFLLDCEQELSSTSGSDAKTMVLGKLSEIITFFNKAAALYSPLSRVVGKFVDFLRNYIGGGGGGILDCDSYTIEIGLPAVVSISFSFNS